jgi:hypothetical protein
MLDWKIWLWMTVLLVLVGCQPQPAPQAAPERLANVAAKGAEVMPFDLERTTHIFEKLDDGGLQQVVSDDGDAAQPI